MLNMYQSRKFVPEDVLIVDDNREYFGRVTMQKLDKRLDGLTKHTDGATFLDEDRFYDKYGAAVPWFCLSTGGMTLLNIFYNPDVCFSTIECGDNVFADIKNIKSGNFIGLDVYDYDGDDKCEICLNGLPGYEFYSVEELME